MTSQISLSSRIAAGINAFRGAGANQTTATVARQDKPSAPPTEARQHIEAAPMSRNIPGERQMVPRGTYVNILV